MIRHTKSAAVPSSLRRGVAATARDRAAYDADPASFRNGTSKFEIAKGIYGTDVVKRVLKADQHNKCAFCEALFDGNVAGDVEHYRPNTAVTIEAGRIYPGYYWLGYDWSNLSYACPDCNGYRKRDRFPLRDEAQRARDHHHDVAAERPLLLDPYGDADPREHITFLGEAPTSDTDEGKATIEVLGLKRTALARDRLAHLRSLDDLRDAMLVAEGDPRPEAAVLVDRFRAKLAAATAPQAKFSAASADHLAARAAGLDLLPPEASAAA